MILSSTSLTAVTEKPSLVEAIDFACRTDSTSYPLADKLRNINIWYLQTGLWIWESATGWKHDDKNATTLPIYTTTLVSNQYDYSIPTTALSIDKVQYLDVGGKYVDLEYKDFERDGIQPENSTAGAPKYYTLLGYSILLDVKIDTAQVTASAGLRVLLSKRVTKFTTTSASVEPGFDEEFHPILIHGAKYEWAKAHQRADLQKQAENDIAILKIDLQKFYSSRATEAKPIIGRKFVSYE